MAEITLTHSDFPQFDEIAALLFARRIEFSLDRDEPCQTLVVNANHMKKSECVIEAKRLGAKRIVLLNPEAGVWGTSSDLGGRLIEVDLPAGSTSSDDQPSTIAFANLLAAPFNSMVAGDPAGSALIDLARRVARHDVNVFIAGPTGSGKEVLCRMIHDVSPRREQPFVALNCAAIPDNMLEAMLFGHEKGAFTGANSANQGYVRAADGGTLLLDEISEMPVALQSKLLRVLQEKAVTPVGSQKEQEVDIRVLATSNRDMEAEIARGNFREDLYFRLNVFPLETLALAQRPGDLIVLAQALLSRHSGKDTCPLLTKGACERILAHEWPGNVRELENVMQRALVLSDGADIRSEDIMLSPTGFASLFRPKASHAAELGAQAA